MVIIMQRLHKEDLIGHLLKGGSADKYHYLNIPAIITPDVGSAEWYERNIKKQQYTHAIPILFDLGRGEGETALWASRKSLETLKEMQRTNPYTFNSQYAGDPSSNGTGLVREEWMNFYTEIPYARIKRTFMTADTASTTKTYSDYTVVCFWGLTYTNELYLLDLELGKFEAPELPKLFVDFWNKHNKFNLRYPCMLPTALYMEDKSSGQFLNQQFIREGKIRCIPIKRDSTSGDKLTRFLNAVPYFAQGRIFLPEVHKHRDHFELEITGMTGMGSGTGHDDCADNVSDACEVAFGKQGMDYNNW